MSEKNHNWVDLPTAPNGAKKSMPVVPEEARAIAQSTPAATSLPTHLMAPAAIADGSVDSATETNETFALGTATNTGESSVDAWHMAPDSSMSAEDTDSWTATSIPEIDAAIPAVADVPDTGAVESGGWTPPPAPDFVAPPVPEVDDIPVGDDKWVPPAALVEDVPEDEDRWVAPAASTDSQSTEFVSEETAETAAPAAWTPPVSDDAIVSGAASDAIVSDAVSDAAADVVPEEASDAGGWNAAATAGGVVAAGGALAMGAASTSSDAAADVAEQAGGWTAPAMPDMPEGNVPDVDAPNFEIPSMDVPEVDVPNMDAPALDDAAVGVPLLDKNTEFGATTTAGDFADGAAKANDDDDDVEGITAFSPVEQDVPDAGSRRKKLFGGLLGIAALALLAFGLFWFLNKDDGAANATPTTEVPDTNEGVDQPVVDPVGETDDPGEEAGDDGAIDELPVGPPPSNDVVEGGETDPQADPETGIDFQLDLNLDDTPVAPEPDPAPEQSTGFVLIGVDAAGEPIDETIDEVCLTFTSPIANARCVAVGDQAISEIAFVEDGVLGVGGVVDGSVAQVEIVYADGARTVVPLTPVFGQSNRWFFTATVDANGVEVDRVEMSAPSGSVVYTIDDLDQLAAG